MLDEEAALKDWKAAYDAWVTAVTYGLGDVDELTEQLIRTRQAVEIARLDRQFTEPKLWEGSD